MPEKFILIFQNKIAKPRFRKRANGYIELRVQIDGKSYSGTGKDEKTATEHFIAALNRESENSVSKSITFAKYTQIWLDTVKKPVVKESTYISYVEDIKGYLLPAFGERKIAEIRQFELQAFLNAFCDKGQYRTAERLHQIMSSIFNYAEIDELVRVSPMKKVIKQRYETQQAVPLTREEESKLISAAKNGTNPYAPAFVFMLYTGLRRSEFYSAKIEGEFVVAVCSKTRKCQKEKTRRIPITPMLKKCLPFIDLNSIPNAVGDILSRNFKKLVPNHHLHELRHTFITRCQECGIRREIVSLWAGHAADSSITSTVYTHLEHNEDLQLSEAKKMNYELP